MTLEVEAFQQIDQKLLMLFALRLASKLKCISRDDFSYIEKAEGGLQKEGRLFGKELDGCRRNE